MGGFMFVVLLVLAIILLALCVAFMMKGKRRYMLFPPRQLWRRGLWDWCWMRISTLGPQASYRCGYSFPCWPWGFVS